MTNDKFKDTFAKAASIAFKTEYSDVMNNFGDKSIFSVETIYESLEKPKDPSMGRFAFPVFKYTKTLKDKPQIIATKISEKIKQILGDALISISSSGGFINVKTNFVLESSEVLTSVFTQDSNYASSDIGKGKRILVEYSAPNIAKPFGIGHIRTTILGNALRRIYLKLGYDAIGLNYLGDWGTQFGKMIVAYKKWGDDSIRGKETVDNLLELYIKFHELAENDESLEEEARSEFKKLEEGDEENNALWEQFREISLNEFNRIYDLMGVEFDWITGEAFLNDKMGAIEQRLESAGLTSISDGATIIDLGHEQLPPALLKKADGATLYLTRDITGFLFRYDKYLFDKMLYVVGTNQSVHFQQLFRVIELLEEAEKIRSNKRIFNKGKHVDFGLIKFGDQMMSTRRGNIIFLDDVIKKASDLAKEKIMDKNPDLIEIDKTAQMIGLGAIFFSQLSVRRQKDVNFNWDEVLSFEGETGPYLQYTHARLSSLLRNYDGKITSEINYKLLDHDEEQRVIELIADFPEAVINSTRLDDPYLIANHLIDLAGAFNKIYQRKDKNNRIDRIISDNKELTSARILMVKAVQIVIKEGLYLLGIQSPNEM
jgi:arginyl-tRNA synthetase